MDAPPLVDPDQPLLDGLVVRLPFPMARRTEDGSLVFWHTPKQLTFWISAHQRDAGIEPLAQWKRRRSPQAYDEVAESDGPVIRYGYRLAEQESDGREPAFYGFIAAGETELSVAAYFNSPDAIADVIQTWRSIRKSTAVG
jgi:hypothetical protein